jgi:hypothetical protein
MFSSYICESLPRCQLHSDIQAEILYAFLTAPTCAIYPVYLILIDWIILMMSDVDYKCA